MKALLTAAEFAAGTNGQVAADDPRVEPLLAGASAAVRRYCGWHITPEITETVTLDGPGGRLLVLPSLRVTEIESITVRGEALPMERWEWSSNGEIMLLSGCWPTTFRGVEITYKHGYTTAPDVQQVVQQVVANGISSSMGAVREQAGQVSVSWSSTAPNVAGGISLLSRDIATLDLYRLPGKQ